MRSTLRWPRQSSHSAVAGHRLGPRRAGLAAGVSEGSVGRDIEPSASMVGGGRTLNGQVVLEQTIGLGWGGGMGTARCEGRDTIAVDGVAVHRCRVEAGTVIDGRRLVAAAPPVAKSGNSDLEVRSV